MKRFLIVMSFALTTSTFANTVSVFSFDEVDAVTANGKTVLVEDLRDGFSSIQGVQVNDNTVSVASESKALILFRNSNKFLPSVMGAKLSGGDGGGG
jgi:hypothetical protein